MLGIDDLDYGVSTKAPQHPGQSTSPDTTRALSAPASSTPDVPAGVLPVEEASGAQSHRAAALAFVQARRVSAAARASIAPRISAAGTPSAQRSAMGAGGPKAARETKEVGSIAAAGDLGPAAPSESAPAAATARFSTLPAAPSAQKDSLAPPQTFAAAVSEGIATTSSGTLPDEWPSGPHQAGPARLLLTLFLLSHGYAQRVPLARLLEYEAALFCTLDRTPAPQAETDGGRETLPAQAHGSLLDAALRCEVNAAMQTGAARHDVADSLLRSSALLALTAAELGAASTEANRRARAAAAAATAPPRPADRHKYGVGLLNWALGRKPEPRSPAPLAQSEPASSREVPAVQQASGDDAYEAACHYVRTDPGVPLEQLPRPWRLLHVAVAEFTRRFCGEPAPARQ
jgi:hypothetical protein